MLVMDDLFLLRDAHLLNVLRLKLAFDRVLLQT